MENKVSGRLGFDDHQRQELRKEIEEALSELAKSQVYETDRQEIINKGIAEGGEDVETAAEIERG